MYKVSRKYSGQYGSLLYIQFTVPLQLKVAGRVYDVEPLRYLFHEKRRDGYHVLSYANALAKSGYESVETTVHILV